MLLGLVLNHGSRREGSVEKAELWVWTVVTGALAAMALRDAVHWYGHPLPPASLDLSSPNLAGWICALGVILAGMLFAGAGIAALWSNPRGAFARAFAGMAIAGGLLMIAFVDARALGPLGLLERFLVPFVVAMTLRCALYVPLPVSFLERHPQIERTAVALAIGAGGLAAGAGLVDRPPALASSHWLSAGAVLYPLLVFAPAATAYAFMRRDFWGARGLLSRRATNVFLGALAAGLAIGAGTALATAFGASFRDALAGAAGGAVAGAALLTAMFRLSEQLLFRSRAEYKPTIDALSEELITLTAPGDVAHAIERTVLGRLSAEFVSLTLEPPERLKSKDTGSAAIVPASRDRTLDDALELERGAMRLEVSFGGAPFGWLDVGPKRGGGLFTSDDIDLLRTVANHGGLALAHAYAYQELEERRRRQAEAWRGEREALVETVAAEIEHEIRYPLNYFRALFDIGLKGGRFSDDDVDVGREEVDRLERLVSGLKRMVAHRIERSPTRLAELCGRVETLLRDSLGRVRIELSLPPDTALRCDPDKLTQVLVNLLSNAVEACGPSGHVGIRWDVTESGGELSVWDDGPGFIGDASRLFNPWYTTKPRGTGLGLAITHRLVRAHGWTITASRRDARTTFVVTVRTDDIVSGALPESSALRAQEDVA